jgi:hypothetical protein
MGPTQPPIDLEPAFLLNCNVQRVKLATYLHLVERLTVSGETSLFPQNTFKTILFLPSDVQVKFKHIILNKDGLHTLLVRARKNSVMGDI